MLSHRLILVLVCTILYAEGAPAAHADVLLGTSAQCRPGHCSPHLDVLWQGDTSGLLARYRMTAAPAPHRARAGRMALLLRRQWWRGGSARWSLAVHTLSGIGGPLNRLLPGPTDDRSTLDMALELVLQWRAQSARVSLFVAASAQVATERSLWQLRSVDDLRATIAAAEVRWSPVVGLRFTPLGVLRRAFGN